MVSADHRGPGRPAGPGGAQGRSALLRATRELLAERGPSQLTLRAVAQRAGVRPPLVNYYFGGKQDLIAAAVEEVAGEMREAVRIAAEREGSTEERVKAMIRTLVHLFGQQPHLPRLVVEQVLLADDQYTDRFAREVATQNLMLVRSVLDADRDSGELAPLELRYAVPSIMGCCVFFFLAAPLMRRLFETDPSDPRSCAEFADQAAEFVWNALRSRRES